ncbi:MAG: Crp/Fnr family transcriptional regulator [Thermoleophilia bacterium]
MPTDAAEMMADLRAAELFARLDDDQLAQVARIARRVDAPADSTLFLSGDPALAFYLLADGRVKVYKLLPHGRTATIRHVRSRQTFAEAALFRDTYPSCAETMSPCRLYSFDTRRFLDLLLTQPQIAVNLLEAMAELLALLNRRVEELLLPVPARLARYLLTLADEQAVTNGPVRLPTSKRELAARLGTVPETLSRTLDRLKRGGVLRAGDDNAIEIVDVAKLRRLAQE